VILRAAGWAGLVSEAALEFFILFQFVVIKSRNLC
jgi:hypothetical protein